MFYQMSMKQCYEAMIYNNDCLLFADIVKIFQHMQSGHPDKPWVGHLKTCWEYVAIWLAIGSKSDKVRW